MRGEHLHAHSRTARRVSFQLAGCSGIAAHGVPDLRVRDIKKGHGSDGGQNILNIESARQRDFARSHDLFFATASAPDNDFIAQVTSICRVVCVSPSFIEAASIVAIISAAGVPLIDLISFPDNFPFSA